MPHKDPEKRREYRKRYYEMHRSEAVEYSRKYYHEHRETVLLKQREYGKKHRKQISARVKRWKESHPEKVREMHRRYYEKHREQILAKSKLYRQLHPQIRKAQKKADYYVPLGQKCELCGSTQNLERHHPDYSNPLKIVTLCIKCHKKIHRANRSSL
jgi:hypothetical protein